MSSPTPAPRRAGVLALLASALIGGGHLAAAPVASFDINDAGGGAFTQPGWIAVSGAVNDAETITGSDGTHTLTITTSGDGQDRERNAGSFPADPELWRDFWFVNEGSGSAVATIDGLEPETDYTVEIWGFDLNSTPTRSATWTDTGTGNSATLTFDGATSPVPTSLSEGVAVVQARSDGAGRITLVAGPGPAAGGFQDIFVSALRVSEAAASELIELEAESGSLGGVFETTELGGATAIGVTTSISAQDAPGDPGRIARYEVTFPAPGSYRLYARVWVGAGAWDDDSLFLAGSFGAKLPGNGDDWELLNGLNAAGYTGANEIVDVGGSAGNLQWKWIRIDGSFTVADGALGQTYEIAGREDGLYLDRLVFAPAELDLTVAELDSGTVDRPETFEGADGIAIHRFAEPNGGRTPDGAHPASGLALVDGELVGTTTGGGTVADGVAFRVSPDGESFATLASFVGAVDGAHPQGDLRVSGGTITSVSAGGGANGTGAIVERLADGTVTRLHSFNALDPDDGSNFGGAVPIGPLAGDGTRLYGATSAGGAFTQGTLFSVASGGGGFSVLHEFGEIDTLDGTNADGARPAGGLVLVDGRLYGTASEGGSGGTGVVFSVSPEGSDFTVLHHFDALDVASATNPGGAFPGGALTVVDGVVYGTALAGGAGGGGTIFAVSTDGSAFVTLFDFPAADPATGINPSGARPAAGLILSGNLLYGTTSGGGRGGTGTVFGLDVERQEFRTLHHFGMLEPDTTNREGAHPVARLLQVGPALYGTAYAGGPGGTGSVFRLPIPVSATLTGEGNPDGSVDVTFHLRGVPYREYRVDYSSDLEEWFPLTTAPADASGILSVTEPGLTAPRRFYRSVDP